MRKPAGEKRKREVISRERFKAGVRNPHTSLPPLSAADLWDAPVNIIHRHWKERWVFKMLEALNRPSHAFVEAPSRMLGTAAPVCRNGGDLNVRLKGPVAKKIGFDFL